jgi:hypothetical protein
MNLGDRLHAIEDPGRVGVSGRETGSGVGVPSNPGCWRVSNVLAVASTLKPRSQL